MLIFCKDDVKIKIIVLGDIFVKFDILRQNNAKYVLCRAVCRIHLDVVSMCTPGLESRLSSMIQVSFDCVQ